jgi:dethiobiotin synthetase
MVNTIFITGIGTDVGKTIAAAILTEALNADYWKPVQAGFDAGTDSTYVQSLISNAQTTIHPETYKLKLPASPHIAAREEGIKIELSEIEKDYFKIINNPKTAGDNQTHYLVIEGAGGLMVPLNEDVFVYDLIKRLKAKVILVSRNYLGSINHSLLTAQVCKTQDIDVLGWIFNDHYMHYEDEIVQWSGYKKIASLPFSNNVTPDFIKKQAGILKSSLVF